MILAVLNMRLLVRSVCTLLHTRGRMVGARACYSWLQFAECNSRLETQCPMSVFSPGGGAGVGGESCGAD